MSEVMSGQQRHIARFQPDPVTVPPQRAVRSSDPSRMVGATGIEPVTPAV